MTWLKRCFWLLAWSVWLYLGVGLYRELPRHPGPTVRRLWEGTQTAPIGFVGQSDLVATRTITDRGRGTTTIEVFDTEGHRLRSTEGPSGLASLATTTIPAMLAKDVYLCGFTPTGSAFGIRSESLRALDLQTGKWTLLSAGGAGLLTVHPQRPLIAFYDDKDPGSVVVANFRTGEKLFQYDLPRRFLLGAPPVFVGDDRIALALEPLFGKPPDGSWIFRVFRIAMPAEPLKTIHGPPIGRDVTSTEEGRIAFLTTQPSGVGVFDLEREAVLFQSPDPDEAVTKWKRGTTKVPVIGASGQMVVSPKHGLLDIVTGASRWRPGAFETIATWSNLDYFTVHENWSALWAGITSKWRLETTAWRSVETGELIWRTWNSTPVAPHLRNAARTLVVMNDGAVRRLPLRVNWMLLAVCQAVLALPLVMLWLVLRLRARRRRRVAGAAA